MINILFVCTGDTCRSTMASAILKDKIRRRGIKNLSCSSAGLFVGAETEMNENAKKVLKRMDVRIPRHKATQLVLDKIIKSSIVLTMTDNQKQTILNRFPNLKNVYSMKDFVGGTDILDPYGKGEGEYFNVARELDVATNRILERLLNERW